MPFYLEDLILDVTRVLPECVLQIIAQHATQITYNTV